MHTRFRILNCKHGDSGQALNSELLKRGFDALWHPLQISEPVSAKPNQSAYDVIIFTSKNAVSCGLGYLNPSQLAKAQIFAIGPATQALLADRGIIAECASAADSESLVNKLNSLKIQVNTALIVKGEGGRNHIQQSLQQQQIQVSDLCCYRRLAIDEQQQQKLIQQLQKLRPTWFIMSNAESLPLLQVILNRAQCDLDCVKLIVPSQRIREIGLNLGFKTVFVSAGPMNDAIINTLTQQLPNSI